MQATNYFNFLTNDDDTRAIYLGGMSTYNFRQYEDSDESFATFLQENKNSFGIPSDINYVSGSDDVYDAFA